MCGFPTRRAWWCQRYIWMGLIGRVSAGAKSHCHTKIPTNLIKKILCEAKGLRKCWCTFENFILCTLRYPLTVNINLLYAQHTVWFFYWDCCCKSFEERNLVTIITSIMERNHINVICVAKTWLSSSCPLETCLICFLSSVDVMMTSWHPYWRQTISTCDVQFSGKGSWICILASTVERNRMTIV